MKRNSLLSGIALLAATVLTAAEPATTPAPAKPTPAAAPAAPAATDTAAPVPEASTVESELEVLVGKINAKLQSGQTSETALADELKAFDALIAAHANEKSDGIGRAEIMRALLYVQVLRDFDRATTLLNEVKTKRAGTEAGNAAQQILSQIEAEKKAAEVKAALQPGAPFPDFEAKDLAGNPISVGKLKGKIVLVDFWATWCGPCVGELPNVAAAYEKYHAKGFEIIGVSLDRDEEKLKSFVADNKMTWPQHFDNEGKIAMKYGVNSIPSTFLVGPDGKIVATDLRGPDLGQQLDRLLGGAGDAK